MGTQQDVLRAQSERTRLLQQKRRDQAAEEGVLAELRRLLDLPPDAPVAVAARLLPEVTLDVPDRDEAVARALEATPEIHDAAALCERSSFAADLAKRGTQPDFVVTAAYMNRGSLPLMWSASVGVTVPLFAGSRTRPVVAEAEGLVEAAAKTEAALRTIARARAEERLVRMRQLADEARLDAEGVLVQDRLSVDAALAGYRSGGVPFVAVLEALWTFYQDRRAAVGRLVGLPPGGRGPPRSRARPDGADSGHPRTRARRAMAECREKKHEFALEGSPRAVASFAAVAGAAPPRAPPAAARVAPAGASRRAAAKAAAEEVAVPDAPRDRQDAPGDCPICGMKLVPIEEAAPAPAATGARTSGPNGLATVTVDARKLSLLGLKTVAVTRAPFETSIRTTGRVAADERRVHHVHTRYEGFVEHVTADFTGKFVKKGEVLALIYSPELYATQQEYLLALKASRSLGDVGRSFRRAGRPGPARPPRASASSSGRSLRPTSSGSRRAASRSARCPSTRRSRGTSRDARPITA